MVKIALAQFQPSHDYEESINKGLELVELAADAGAKFIGFTELSFRPFFPQFNSDPTYFSWAENMEGTAVTAFTAAAQQHKIDCAVNFFETTGNGVFYDTTVICRPDGEILGPVRMAHAASEPGFDEKYYYWPGDTKPQVYDLGYMKIGVAICYDRHFPEYTRELVIQGAELIFCPFAGLVSDPMQMYEIEMQALAFQNQVFVACLNRVGKEKNAEFAGGSFVVGPDGDISTRGATNTEHLLLADIDSSKIGEFRIKRPFMRDRRPSFYQ